MKNLKRDLQTVKKDITGLIKKVEKLITAVDKVGQPKTVKKAVAKKAVARKPIKASAKKKAAKKQGKPTAIDAVLSVISRSRKGVDVAGLRMKTGFKDRKIYDIVKVLKKKGKIKTAGIGIYIKM